MYDRGHTERGNAEIDFKPFMNLMVALIPVLLISAEFARISIIDANLTADERGCNINDKQKERFPENTSNKLILTVVVTDSAITVGSKSGFLPSITCREYHEYVAKDDRRTFKVEYTPGAPVLHPDSKREMNLNERYEMYLYATDSGNNLIHAWYTKNNELLLDNKGNPVMEIAVGDTAYTPTNPRRMLVVMHTWDYERRHLSACDVLKTRLTAVKMLYPHVEDSSDIIIASESTVLYDKIIKIMDVAREADFSDISITKLRDI